MKNEDNSGKPKAKDVEEQLPPAGFDEATDRSTGKDRTDESKKVTKPPVPKKGDITTEE